jgi:hypothetical protein
LEIKEKTKSYYSNNSRPVKGLCKNSDTIKRPNLRIMGNEEEEVQAKGIRNIFNKIITNDFPNLFPFRNKKPPGHQTDLTIIELPQDILSLKPQAHRIEKEY